MIIMVKSGWRGNSKGMSYLVGNIRCRIVSFQCFSRTLFPDVTRLELSKISGTIIIIIIIIIMIIIIITVAILLIIMVQMLMLI